MFGFTLPIPASSIENENDLPALGRLKTSVSIAEGYSVVKTLLTDDGNLFMLTRKAGALDAIWWSRRKPNGDFSLYLNEPVVVAESGYGPISDFDYTPEIPGVAVNALLVVGYSKCPLLSLNSGGFTVRNSSVKPGAFVLYAIQDNYNPAVLVSAGQDTTFSSWHGGVDGWMDFHSGVTSSFTELSAAQIGYQVRFVYLNQSTAAPALYVAVGMPYYGVTGSSAHGQVVLFQIVNNSIQYYYDTSKTVRVGFTTPLYGAQYGHGLNLATNCKFTSYDNSGDIKLLSSGMTNNSVVVTTFTNNGGTGNLSSTVISESTKSGFGAGTCVTKDYLFVFQSKYTGVIGLGHIWVYRWISSAWVAVHDFGPPYFEPSSLSNFGTSMDVSQDGTVLVVSEPDRHTYGNSGQIAVKYEQAGSVHVYEKTSTYGSESEPYLYVYTQTILPSSLTNGLKFGSNICLAPATTKLDANATSNPHVNAVCVVSSGTSAITIFTAGGFNGHVANDD